MIKEVIGTKKPWPSTYSLLNGYVAEIPTKYLCLHLETSAALSIEL